MNNIPYNFPVMEKAKREREKAWDIYKLNRNAPDEGNMTMWDVVVKEFWGDGYEDVKPYL